MLTVNQRIVPNSRTPHNGSAWIAEATVDGKLYSARSRRGAPMALARELVAAGVSDRPVRVAEDGVAGYLTYPSLHRMATRTMGEGAASPVGERKWVLAGAVWGKTGGEAPGGEEQAVESFPALAADTSRLKIDAVVTAMTDRGIVDATRQGGAADGA